VRKGGQGHDERRSRIVTKGNEKKKGGDVRAVARGKMRSSKWLPKRGSGGEKEPKGDAGARYRGVSMKMTPRNKPGGCTEKKKESDKKACRTKHTRMQRAG